MGVDFSSQVVSRKCSLINCSPQRCIFFLNKTQNITLSLFFCNKWWTFTTWVSTLCFRFSYGLACARVLSVRWNHSADTTPRLLLYAKVLLRGICVIFYVILLGGIARPRCIPLELASLDEWLAGTVAVEPIREKDSCSRRSALRPPPPLRNLFKAVPWCRAWVHLWSVRWLCITS